MALSNDGASEAKAEVVVRSPPLRERVVAAAPAGRWHWQELGPFETRPHARLVLRCLAGPEASCRFGQPHLLRQQSGPEAEGQ